MKNHGKHFPPLTGWIWGQLVLMALTAGCLAMGQKPNILFIMSDDHTTQAIGAYGSRLATLNPTPVIDSLAREGMRFDRVYCNNSICTPSRASIITGQYPQTNGVLDLLGSISPEKQFLPAEIKKAGYQTAMIGKWHLSEEPAAFDYYCVLPGQGKYYDPEFRIRGDKPWPENTIQRQGEHSSDAITDISLDWLENKRDKGRPFLLMHHFKAPHDLFTHAKRYDKYLEDVDIPEPENLFDPPMGSKSSQMLGSGLSKEHSYWQLPGRLGISKDLDEPEFTRETYQVFLKRYLRCVKGVDDNIKRLVNYLKETGELENTIILYTGDQGFLLGEHDLMDKRWMYEESFRMPLIAYSPKLVNPGTVNDWLINNTDFAPTILDLAGVANTPGYMQGRSFATALKGTEKPGDWRKVTYYRYWMHMAHKLRVPAHFGVRSERYKLIFFYGVDYHDPPDTSDWGSQADIATPAGWEFYDTQEDPFEMNNLYGKPEYMDVIRELKSELKKTREELNETDANYPHIQAIIRKHWDD